MFNRIANRLHMQKASFVSILLMLYDAFAMIFSYGACLWVRFDCHLSEIPPEYITPFFHFIPIYVVVGLAIFALLKLYNSIWRFASYVELERIMVASVITAAFHIVAITLLFYRMPITYYVFGALVQFALVLGIRFSYRLVLLMRASRKKTAGKRVMLIGAGQAGRIILRDILQDADNNDQVCCIIDDNPNKWGRSVDGVKVVGGRDDIFAAVEKFKIDRIYIAISTITPEQKRDILNICKDTGCEIRNLPAVQDLLHEKITVSSLQEVQVEDLLGRDTVQVNMNEIFEYLKGKVILITGGGGSIGSELSRQIASHQPKQLILFDVYENNVYDIQQELKRSHPDLNLVVLIGSVRDSRRLMQVFETYRPQVVYHAAAHKHVPLMEDSPCESIKNNVLGTYKTAYMAALTGVERFVLISTDKAVNPTNIMGASKRLCEMIIQTFDKLIREGHTELLPSLYTHQVTNPIPVKIPKETHTEFVAVRFGNVLGSNGSVIPLFKRQIAEGGPVTVTHPDIIRYFMTIPEAVSLVLQAGTYAHGGEIFVLDMGSPVKIDDLARNLIKLSGLQPDVDIRIEYTGLRPGEKLYEEKLMAEEGLRKTENELIHVGQPIEINIEKFLVGLAELKDVCYRNDEDIREYVMKLVPTYHPAD